MGTPASTPPNGKRFDRIIAVIGVVIALLGMAAAIWQGVIANGARKDAQEATRGEQEARAKQQQAENEAQEAKKKVEEERAKFCRFTENYRTLISELNKAISRYSERPSQENKNSVIASAAALADYVSKWRQVQKSLGGVLDGNVDRLQQAASSGDVDAIRLQAQIVSKVADSQFPLLDSMLESASAVSGGSGEQTAPGNSPPATPTPSPTTAEGGKEEVAVKDGINCDCSNTQASNIGGAATRQCLASERGLKTAASRGQLKLQVQDRKVVSSNMNLCDSVTAGPGAWPAPGAPAKSPY